MKQARTTKILRTATLASIVPIALWSAGFAPQDGDSETRWTQAELERQTADIQREVADLRKAEFTRPVAVKMANKREFIDYAIERTEKSSPPERTAADETITKMLGLIPADMDMMQATLDLLESQVGGFYDPADETFFLMEGFDGDLARIILSHELAHALDDQLYDIDGGMDARSGNSDASLAYHAVVEGSGTAVMTRWTLANMRSLDLGGFSEMQTEQNAAMAKVPIALWKPLLASYLCGAAFLARTDNVMAGQMKPAENADIDAAFGAPPASTEQILHPEKYWDLAQRDEPRDVRQAADELPNGWAELRRDRMGELVLALLVCAPEDRVSPDLSNQMALIGMSFTNELAAGWGGDEVLLLGKDDARYLRLATVWDTPRDAAEFYGGLMMLLPGLRARAAELGERGGAEVAYEGEDGVVLEVHFGLRRSDLRKVRGAFGG